MEPRDLEWWSRVLDRRIAVGLAEDLALWLWPRCLKSGLADDLALRLRPRRLESSPGEELSSDSLGSSASEPELDSLDSLEYERLIKNATIYVMRKRIDCIKIKHSIIQ